MKTNLALTLFLLVFGFQSNAQCPANDSTSMGSGASNDVFYSFNNHSVSTVSNMDWHMAFSVQGSRFPASPANGVAIRVNSGGNGTMLKRLNGADAGNWRSIDTAGFYALPDLLDSDSTWDLSAFTDGYPVVSDPFDFIWGRYNQNIYSVEGTSVFVLYNQTEGWYKKVFIRKCEYDTLWNFVISNIDNTDSSNVQFLKKSYPNKLFVYYNALTKQFVDREPVKTAWDLVWTKYKTNLGTQGSPFYYTVAGVFSNPAVTVEQNMGKKCNQVWLTNRTSKVDPSISAIGYDWKTYDQANSVYTVTDTFVYFVKAQDAKTYKMTFKSYVGGPLGKSTFNFYEATTNVSKIGSGHIFSVYPNPSNGFLSIKADVDINGIHILDMQGKTVYTGKFDGRIDISGLASGLYMISVDTNVGVYHRRIVKE